MKIKHTKQADVAATGTKNDGAATAEATQAGVKTAQQTGAHTRGATASQVNSQATSTATQLESLQAQIGELTADLQRTRADFENYRKQVELQREQAKQAATLATVEKILPLVDNVERALATYPEQLSPLAKSFSQTLNDLGLVRIETAPDTEFNPDLHEAVMVEGDGTREVIAETLRPGYTYQGAVLRAAMVKVKRVD